MAWRIAKQPAPNEGSQAEAGCERWTMVPALAQIRGDVVGGRNEVGCRVIEQCGHDAETLDGKTCPQVQPTELLRPLQLSQLLGLATNQDEAPEITAVGLEDGDLDRFTLAIGVALVL